MKRYLLFLVVALLAIGCFTACSSDDNEGEESVTHLLPTLTNCRQLLQMSSYRRLLTVVGSI